MLSCSANSVLLLLLLITSRTLSQLICNSWNTPRMFYLVGGFIKELCKCGCTENRSQQINIWTEMALVHSFTSVCISVCVWGWGCLGQCYWDWSQTVYCLEFDGVWFCIICICLYDTLWMKPSINHWDKNNRNRRISCIGMTTVAAEKWACSDFLLFHYLFPSRPTLEHQKATWNIWLNLHYKNVCKWVLFYFIICCPLQGKIWKSIFILFRHFWQRHNSHITSYTWHTDTQRIGGKRRRKDQFNLRIKQSSLSPQTASRSVSSLPCRHLRRWNSIDLLSGPWQRPIERCWKGDREIWS